MDPKLSEEEQKLATEFQEKLEVTETPVPAAPDSATFEPAPAPETPAEPAPEPPVEAPANN